MLFEEQQSLTPCEFTSECRLSSMARKCHTLSHRLKVWCPVKNPVTTTNILSFCLSLSFVVSISQEEQNRGKPNWEHLNEELHVLITVEDTQTRAEIKMRRAVEEVKKLLVPAVSWKHIIYTCASGKWFATNVLTSEIFSADQPEVCAL